MTKHGIPVVMLLVILGTWMSTGELNGQQARPPLPDPGSPPPPFVQPPAGTGRAAEDTPAQENAGEPDLERKRDPFWPVGYVPRKPAPPKPPSGAGVVRTEPEVARPRPVDWDAARKSLDIRGISLIGRDRQSNAPKYLAVIGGKIAESGDTVSVVFDARVYRWKVVSIGPDGISLVKVDARPE